MGRRGVYRSYFASAGYRVETASDAVACINRLNEGCPDLLLLDYQLPWGGGDRVLAALRDDRSFARIPVVLIADFIPIHDLSRLLTRPVIRCLQRRCSVQALRFCVDSTLALSEKPRTVHRGKSLARNLGRHLPRTDANPELSERLPHLSTGVRI